MGGRYDTSMETTCWAMSVLAFMTLQPSAWAAEDLICEETFNGLSRTN